MIHFQESIKDVFPFIQQTISDAYRTDTWLFSYPYQDVSKIDRGFRKMVWKRENYTAPLQQALQISDSYRMLVIQSTLDFYNIIFFLDQEPHPSFLSVGPFRDREMSEIDLSKIMQTHRLPADSLPIIRDFYYNLPIIDIPNLTKMLQHLLIAFLPEESEISPQYINYSEHQRSFTPSDADVKDFSYEFAEETASRINLFLETMLSGNNMRTMAALSSLLDHRGFNQSMPLHQIKQTLFSLNDFCCCRLLTTQIHPGFIMERHSSYKAQIKNIKNQKKLLQLPFEIARKYCLLIRNYSFSEYSFLIRNVMNYITLHLSDSLSLSVIADFFQKNPSYLSGQFRKETGESLTDYIQKERMQTAIRYFNTTNMSVAEVAGCVGIHDFSYFSRIFKKYIGQSPSQYRKLVKT